MITMVDPWSPVLLADPSSESPSTTESGRMDTVLDAIRSGDKRALDQLVVDLTPLLWQVARAQGLDRDSAADVVQVTWMTFIRHLGDIHTPAAITGWLVTVTRRDARRQRAVSNRHPRAEAATLDDEPDTDPLPEDQMLESEQRQVLWSAVGKLDPRCQELLRVVAFASRPDYEAVGRALNMPRGSIGPTRGRCLAKLRTLLTADRRWSRP